MMKGAVRLTAVLVADRLGWLNVVDRRVITAYADTSLNQKTASLLIYPQASWRTKLLRRLLVFWRILFEGSRTVSEHAPGGHRRQTILGMPLSRCLDIGLVLYALTFPLAAILSWVFQWEDIDFIYCVVFITVMIVVLMGALGIRLGKESIKELVGTVFAEGRARDGDYRDMQRGIETERVNNGE